ncbi:MAG: OadG family transporter subunit [Spirochaetia bacterium]|nr:OadG family transporter subunit [Spirochaetia bacterium]
MIANGLILMVMGMGIVFVFLVILIYASKLTSLLITKFFPVKEAPVQAVKSSGSNNGSDVEVAIAIAAARSMQ